VWRSERGLQFVVLADVEKDGGLVVAKERSEVAGGVEDEGGELLGVGEFRIPVGAKRDSEDGVSAVESAQGAGEGGLRESHGDELRRDVDVVGERQRDGGA
jgi:hypothetical protein